MTTHTTQPQDVAIARYFTEADVPFAYSLGTILLVIAIATAIGHVIRRKGELSR